MLALLASGCDRLPEAVIVPEFEFSYSFESGLGGWTEGSADLGAGRAAAGTTTGQAAAGSASLAFGLDNPGGAGKIWVTRELAVAKDQSYTVDITLKLGSADAQAAAPWKVIAGARQAAPTAAAGLPIQDETTAGGTGGGVAWAGKSYSFAAKADPDGRLFLTLGIWGTSAGERTYWIDDVRVVLTRS
jgi:hypothetical protein